MDRGEIRSVTTGKGLLRFFYFYFFCFVFQNANALEGSKSHGLGRSILLLLRTYYNNVGRNTVYTYIKVVLRSVTAVVRLHDRRRRVEKKLQ